MKPNYRSVLAAAWLIAGTATAADDGRVPADAAGLTMQDAAQQAVQHQPLLDELDARARAERESAIAARQLPDPSLIAGVSNLPVDTADAYSLRRDSDTQLQIGLNQELTRGRKRALRGDVGDARAAGYAIERRATERSVRRDAALAWLALWRNLRIVELAQANLIQAQTQRPPYRSRSNPIARPRPNSWRLGSKRDACATRSPLPSRASITRASCCHAGSAIWHSGPSAKSCPLLSSHRRWSKPCRGFNRIRC